MQRDKLLNGLPTSAHPQLDTKVSDEQKVLKVTPRVMVPSSTVCPVSIKQTDSSTSNHNITLRNLITSPESFKVKKTCKMKNASQEAVKDGEKSSNLQKPAGGDAMQSASAPNENEPNAANRTQPCASEKAKDGDAKVSSEDNDNVGASVFDGSSESFVNAATGAVDVDVELNEQSRLNISFVLSGFTAKDAASLTVGQLYLMVSTLQSFFFLSLFLILGAVLL